MSTGNRVHHMNLMVDDLALLERADEVRVMSNPTELDDDIPLDEVRAVLTRGRGRITADMCSRLPNLVVVGRCGAGLDNIDTVAARAADVAVVHPGRTTTTSQTRSTPASNGPEPRAKVDRKLRVLGDDRDRVCARTTA